MGSSFIITSGYLGMFIAVIHGYLGETKVVRSVKGLSSSKTRILNAIMFLSAVYWFAGGMALAISPYYMDSGEQHLAALIVGAMYLSGAIGNFWAIRGFHIGWMLLLCAVMLAWGGVLLN